MSASDPDSPKEVDMAARTITLPDHVAAWIDEQVAAGEFASDDEVIVDLVEQAMSSGIAWNDDPELLEAIAEIDRGEGIVVTDISAFFDEIEKRASEAAARGDEVPDDLKY
jgi:Arc/MetJ-type ribon-helix-helix transcriptional regulator